MRQEEIANNANNVSALAIEEMTQADSLEEDEFAVIRTRLLEQREELRNIIAICDLAISSKISFEEAMILKRESC